MKRAYAKNPKFGIKIIDFPGIKCYRSNLQPQNISINLIRIIVSTLLRLRLYFINSLSTLKKITHQNGLLYFLSNER